MFMNTPTLQLFNEGSSKKHQQEPGRKIMKHQFHTSTRSKSFAEKKNIRFHWCGMKWQVP